jgi:hypothetical protein
VAISCSALSDALGEPLPGTAVEASAWLLVEQPGPWGAKALVESRLDSAVGAELDRRCSEAGVKLLLVKRPGRDLPGRRRAFLVSSRPSSAFLEQVVVDEPRALLDLDLEQLAQGGRAESATPVQEPMYLVCTNGKRDACCARLGRPIARALERERPGTVWECSHTGGHRFAGVLICLPEGLCYGRVSEETAVQIVESYEARRVEPPWFRGRSSLDGAAQAAEAYLRLDQGIRGIDELRVSRNGGGEVVLEHADLARYVVRVRLEQAGSPRPTSCRDLGEQGKRPPVWVLESVERA